MNHIQSYADVHHQSHMSANPAHTPSSGASSMGHYQQQYQPPLLQPGPQNYPSQSSYPQYSYSNGVAPSPASAHPASASMSNAMVPASLPLPAMSSAPGSAIPGSQNYQGHQMDTTGQIAPPGMKPRVTATLWEDEGSLCFQVEAKGVCVARREDNHMINGTKLLNVAGMTRGRRDGILKSEKTRHVVKIGPMHLKGVWIPFERALDFANKEKITEQLYPLFVHDIGALLYHPSNQNRSNVGPAAALASMDRRRAVDPLQTNRYLGTPQTSQAPSLHHHAMSGAVGPHVSQPPHAIQPHPSSARPGLDRANTFPTPPTSASSIMGMGNQSSSYEWSGPAVNGLPASQPLSIDTNLSNARSVPTTPATTPPGNMQGMPQYQTTQGYDTSRQLYTTGPTQQSQYGSQPQGMMRYGAQPIQQNNAATYPKSEMAPPVRAAVEQEAASDSKPPEGIIAQNNEQVGHAAEEEADHENESEYTHTTQYSANRAPYGYAPNSNSAALHGEAAHLSPEMTGSPSHQNTSGRATPRTTATSQTWSAGYNATPQRGPQATSSNLYHVMTDNRGTATNGTDGYAASTALPAGYGSQTYSAPNGLPPPNKRVRELDDDEQDGYGRPSSRDTNGEEIGGLKRRRTIHEDTVGGAVGGPRQQPISQRRGR